MKLLRPGTVLRVPYKKNESRQTRTVEMSEEFVAAFEELFLDGDARIEWEEIKDDDKVTSG